MSVFLLLRAAAALAGVIALIWLLRRLGETRPALRARLGTGPERRLSKLESLAIDTRRRLHLISLDGREYLVLTGGGDSIIQAREDAP